MNNFNCDSTVKQIAIDYFENLGKQCGFTMTLDSAYTFNTFSHSDLKFTYNKNNKQYKYEIEIKERSGYTYEDFPDIMFNDKTHLVSTFKEHLIMNDRAEFLKRYYNLDESFIRLPKFFEYYELYSKIFPNYTAITESKYLYQNIQKKQKMIDQQEQMEIEKQQNKNKENNSIVKRLAEYSEFNGENTNGRNKKSKENIFSTDIINSILSKSNTEEMEILFSINKKNISKDEKSFSDKIHNLVLSITKFDEKKKR